MQRIDVVWIWCAGIMAAAALMACLNPPFQAPDEPMHLARAVLGSGIKRTDDLQQTERYILEILPHFHFWQYVHFPEPKPTPDRFYDAPLLRLKPSQFAKPWLYYDFSRSLIRLFHVESVVGALYLLRLEGLLLTFLTLVLWGLIARELTNDPLLSVLTLSLALTPQYIFMAGSANSAGMAWFCGSVILFGSISLFKSKHLSLPLVMISAGIFISLISHRSALIVLPAPFTALILRISRRKAYHKQSKPCYSASFVLGCLSLTAWAIVARYRPELIRQIFQRIARITGALHFDLNEVVLSKDWWVRFCTLFFKSTWLSFGWLTGNAPSRVYFILLIATALPTIGLLIRYTHGKHPANDTADGIVLICFSAVMGAIGVAVLLMALQGDLSQGRYLFPAWPAFGVLWGIGWHSLVSGPRRIYLQVVPFLFWSLYLYALFGVLIISNYFVF